MMQFKKARLSLAMALALTGGLGATTGATAAEISADGLGQALIFPYYSVRNGQTSLFNITNTSDDTVAVKVRFRESHNSRDVLDFNLVLSPYDVWTGFLADSEAGPVLRSDDSSCTVPNMGTGGFLMSNFGYTGSYADGGSDDIDRAREGYVEVIALGRTDTDPALNPATADSGGNYMAYNAKHVDGTPRDCATVASRFVAEGSNLDSSTVAMEGFAANASYFQGTGLEDTNGADQSADNAREDLDTMFGSNPLKGNFTLLNSDEGVAGGTGAIAITDFVNDASINLVTAQAHPYFLEPTLMSTHGLWTVNEEIPLALRHATMANEWSSNADTNKNGTLIDWVVTMPTKNFYVDYAEKDMYATADQDAITENNWNSAMNSARNYTEDTSRLAAAQSTGLSVITGFTNAFTGTSNVGLNFDAYDREEAGGAISGSTSVSPQPAGTSQSLPYEVNVLTFNGNDTLSSEVKSNITMPSTVNGNVGWLSADIGNVPAVGFMFKKRNFGDNTKNFGQIVNHGYTPAQ